MNDIVGLRTKYHIVGLSLNLVQSRGTLYYQNRESHSLSNLLRDLNLSHSVLGSLEKVDRLISITKSYSGVNLNDKISKFSTVVASKDQVSCDLVGEAVILHLTSGIYYGLNSVGAHVWKLLQEPRTVAELLHSILETYDVVAEQCETDLFDLLHELAVNELIVVEAGTDGTAK